MNYLKRQYILVKKCLRNNILLEDTLSIKFYIQQNMCNEIARLLAPESRILEVGVGGSLTIHMLSNLGFDCYALDNNEMSLEYSSLLKRQFLSKVELIRANAFSIPFPEHYFDYVYSVGLIEHFNEEKQKQLVSEMLRCTKEFIHVEVPNYQPTSAFYSFLLEEEEKHYAYDLNEIFSSLDIKSIILDGRGCFNIRRQLEKNSSLKSFVISKAPELYKRRFRSGDIDKLCLVENKLNPEERTRYGFQIYMIGEVDS